jgi:hypothetical protein
MEMDSEGGSNPLPVVLGVAGGVVLCTITCLIIRVWKRNRYYKKVQHSLDEEERAFQECAPCLLLGAGWQGRAC